MKPSIRDSKNLLESVLNGIPYGSYNDGHRTCLEKKIALALYLLGVEEVKVSFSYFIGGDYEWRGMLANTNSIEATPYAEIENMPALWYVLKKANIGYSGAAGKDRGNYAQASWLKEASARPYLIVIYFNEIKRADSLGKLKF